MVNRIRVRWLVVAAAAVAAAVYFVTGPDHGGGPPAHPAAGHTGSPSTSAEQGPAPRDAESPESGGSATPRSRPAPSGLPVAGGGKKADAAIQEMLERTSPRRISADTERRAVRAAWARWRAEVTGEDSERARYRYTRVRLRAGIARETKSRGRLVVHLVWAGADPRGEFRDDRTERLLVRKTSGGWKVAT